MQRGWVIKVVIVLALVLSTGCASSKFNKARESDSVWAYDQFLEDYGDSKYASEARRLREDAAFERASYRGIAGYTQYLNEYPQGRHRKAAGDAVKRIEAENAMLEAVVARVRASRSAREQAVILSHATGSLKYRLQSDSRMSGYFKVLDNLRMTSRDIVVTAEESDCTDIPIVGMLCTDYVYAGKVLKGDIVFVEPNKDRLRTIHQEKDLARIDVSSGNYEIDGWDSLLKKEAYGGYRDFKSEKGLRDYQLFDREISGQLVEKYYPTRFSQKSSSAHGGIAGFIQDHPIASLVIGAAIVTAFSDDESVGSSSSNSRSYSSSYGSSGATSGSTGFFGTLLGCAGQAMAGQLVENPVAAGAISESIRAGLEDDSVSLRGASAEAAKSYITGRLRSEGNAEAAALVEAGDFLMCAISSR